MTGDEVGVKALGLLRQCPGQLGATPQRGGDDCPISTAALLNLVDVYKSASNPAFVSTG
jgi:hypothetical protein